jgi:hypothetical protein
LLQNGYRTNNFKPPVKEIDISYIPIITETRIQDKLQYRLADFWMIKCIATNATAKLYEKVLLAEISY